MPKVVLIHCFIYKQTKYILTTKADHIVHPVLQPSDTPGPRATKWIPHWQTRDLNQNSLRTAVPRNKGIQTNFIYAAQQNGSPRELGAAALARGLFCCAA